MISSTTAPGRLKALVKRLTMPPPPPAIRRRFRDPGPGGLRLLAEALERHYFGDDRGYLETPEGKVDLEDHVHGRLDVFRATVIPWLDDSQALSGADVLEVGCGTGSSTVALAEQGARVVAVDILPGSLEVARQRCSLYGLQADFQLANAAEAGRLFETGRFDLIIFFASLEHMTGAERLAAMRGTWELLGAGGHWCVIETPNRLWFFDGHTSHLPFFHWLPDELAFQYSRFSPRPSLNNRFREPGEANLLEFLRLGRGLSYHEFELAMLPAERLDVVSSLQAYLRKRSPARHLAWKLTRESRYETFLAGCKPGLHPGFFHQSLDLIIRKH